MTRKSPYRTAFVIVFSIASILTLPTAAFAEETAYTDAELHFSFKAPEGWVAYDRAALDTLAEEDYRGKLTGREPVYFAGFHAAEGDYPQVLLEHFEEDPRLNSGISFTIARERASGEEDLADYLSSILKSGRGASGRLRCRFTSDTYKNLDGIGVSCFNAAFPGTDGTANLSCHILDTDFVPGVEAFIEILESASFEGGCGFDGIPEDRRRIAAPGSREMGVDCSFNLPPEWDLTLGPDDKTVRDFVEATDAILGCGGYFGAPNKTGSMGMPYVAVAYGGVGRPMLARIAEKCEAGVLESGLPESCIRNIVPGVRLVDAGRMAQIFAMDMPREHLGARRTICATFPSYGASASLIFFVDKSDYDESAGDIYLVIDSFRFDENAGYMSIPASRRKPALEGKPRKVASGSGHYEFEIPEYWEKFRPGEAVDKAVRNIKVAGRSFRVDGCYRTKCCDVLGVPVIVVLHGPPWKESPEEAFEELKKESEKESSLDSFKFGYFTPLPGRSRISDLSLDKGRNTVTITIEAETAEMGDMVIRKVFFFGSKSVVLLVQPGLKSESDGDKALVDGIVSTFAFAKGYEFGPGLIGGRSAISIVVWIGVAGIILLAIALFVSAKNKKRRLERRYSRKQAEWFDPMEAATYGPSYGPKGQEPPGPVPPGQAPPHNPPRKGFTP